MFSNWKSVVAVALLLPSACEREGISNETANAPNASNVTAGAQPNATAEATNAATGPTAPSSILAWSKPAAGSTVSGPVNELVLHFTPPARLGEVTVTGPEGAMPMMITAVGEVEHYSLPLSGLGPGRYTVDWKARTGDVDHRGSFGFEVR